VDFAQFTTSLDLLGQTAMEACDPDPRDLQRLDLGSRRYAAIETGFNALPSDVECPQPGRLYCESLQVTVSFSLMLHFSTLSNFDFLLSRNTAHEIPEGRSRQMADTARYRLYAVQPCPGLRTGQPEPALDAG